jgi:hypothetical protein
VNRPHTDKYEITWRDHMKWLKSLYDSSSQAEASANQAVAAARSSTNNNQEGVKSEVPGAKHRLEISRVSLAEALKVQDARWTVQAILELIINRAVRDETRARLSPSIAEWINQHDAT